MRSTAKEYCAISKSLGSLGLWPNKATPEELEIHTATSLRTLQNDWDELVAFGHPLSSKLCEVYEANSPSNFSYRYAIVYFQGLPLMCAFFQVVRITPDNLRPRKKNDFLRFATNLMLNIHEVNLLICGNVFKESSLGFCYDNEKVTKEEANYLLEKCIQALSKTESFSAVMLKDMPEGFQFQDPSKSQKLEDDITMQMEIDPSWQSLADYQSALSKKYATRAKKIIQTASPIQVRELNLIEIEGNKKQLHQLYEQVLQQQAFAFGTLHEDYLPAMKKVLGSNFSIYGLYDHETLVGFYSTLSKEKELEVHYIGIDYEQNATFNLYFYIHFLVLQDAISQKKEILNMGRTSLEAKAILGCKPKYNNTFLQFRQHFAECAFGYFKKNMSESDNWKSRNPIKEFSALNA